MIFFLLFLLYDIGIFDKQENKRLNHALQISEK